MVFSMMIRWYNMMDSLYLLISSVYLSREEQRTGFTENIMNVEAYMETLMLNEMEVQRLLDPDVLLDALAEGFKALSEGQVDAPKRIGITVPDTGFLLSMPA